MNKKLKIFLILVVIGLVVGSGGVYYVFNMPHRDVKGEEAAFNVEAAAFYTEYSNDEEASNVKFGDKVIEVTGSIVELSGDEYEITVVLNDEMEGISCALDSVAIANNKDKVEAFKVGDKVTLKGKCDGFDMIMGVVLTRCFIIE